MFCVYVEAMITHGERITITLINRNCLSSTFADNLGLCIARQNADIRRLH